MKNDCLQPFLTRQGFMVLDGGLATELEARGHDLNHRLWSARLLLSAPEAIAAVHRDYLQAGADCIVTATYQASLPGLVAEGLTEDKAGALMADAVALACDTRDAFWQAHVDAGRLRPLVAASVGPYGAFLADGSEYRGNYGVSKAELKAFHLPRWQILSESHADLLACETLPSEPEAEVVRELLAETPAVRAWVSFSCRDGTHLRDGTPLAACTALFDDCEQVAAVGVNCTAPGHVPALIDCVCRGAPSKAVVVYPNSGETYDARRRTWTGTCAPLDFEQAAVAWYERGATLIGGCCRTGPAYVQAIRKALCAMKRPGCSADQLRPV